VHTAPVHSELDVLAADVQLLADAVNSKQLLTKLMLAQRYFCQPMKASELIEMQNTEEAIETAEKLNDEEICDLVISSVSANAEALKIIELQADE
jgi:hypothetical protein